MKEQEFKDWLSRRLWKGEPLTKKGINTRVRRSLRAERGLKGLGFSQTTLDEVFDAGKWEELLAKLTELANDPKPDMAIVRAVVPKADDPNGQLSNMIAGLKQYGYFRDAPFSAGYTVHGSTDRLHLRSIDLVREEAAIVADLAALFRDWHPIPLQAVG